VHEALGMRGVRGVESTLTLTAEFGHAAEEDISGRKERVGSEGARLEMNSGGLVSELNRMHCHRDRRAHGVVLKSCCSRICRRLTHSCPWGWTLGSYAHSTREPDPQRLRTDLQPFTCHTDVSDLDSTWPHLRTSAGVG
jgi:hypothetical protein